MKHVWLRGPKGLFIPAQAAVQGGKEIPWYLLGDVPAANCLMAYQWKGAVSQSESYVNLANPGTYTLTDGTAGPAWDTAIGLTFTRANSQYLNIGGGTGPVITAPFSYLIRLTPANPGTNRFLFGGGANTVARLSMDTANKHWVVLNATGIGPSTTSVTTNKVIGFTYDASGNFIFYLNGSSDGTGTQLVTPTGDNDRIGRHVTSDYYGGVLVASAIHNVVLTPTQVGLITTSMAAL